MTIRSVLDIIDGEVREMAEFAACLTDEKWQAIMSNDATYNGQFYYGVKTTRIFCKPSCQSRFPYFITLFKKLTGFTPVQFRNREGR